MTSLEIGASSYDAGALHVLYERILYTQGSGSIQGCISDDVFVWMQPWISFLSSLPPYEDAAPGTSMYHYIFPAFDIVIHFL